MRWYTYALSVVALLAAPVLYGCGSSGGSGSSQRPWEPQSVTQSEGSIHATAESPGEGKTTGQTPNVATIAGVAITYPEFVHQYAIKVREGSRVTLDPPSYTKCIQQLGEGVPTGRHKPSAAATRTIDAERRTTCERFQREITDGTMHAMIRREWSLLAAKQAGLTITSGEVHNAAQEQLTNIVQNKMGRGLGGEERMSPQALKEERREIQLERKNAGRNGRTTRSSGVNLELREKRLAQEEAQMLASERAKDQEYLKATGSTMADLEATSGTKLLFRKLEAQAVKKYSDAAEHPPAAAPVMEHEIESYYRRHVREFTTRLRDVEVIVTKTLSSAEKAKAAIEHGESFAKAIKRYAQEYSPQDGKQTVAEPNNISGRGMEPLTVAEFSAPAGRLLGPIKSTGFVFEHTVPGTSKIVHSHGYYVLRIKRIHPPSVQSLSQASTTIRSTLTAKHNQPIEKVKQALEKRGNAALSAFEKSYVEKWTSQTSCAKGYIIGLCTNASSTAKAAELPAPPQSSMRRSATPVQGKPHGALQTITVVADPSGAPNLTSPSHYTAHPGDVKFKFVNNSPVPNSFGVEETGATSPAEFFGEFVEETKSMTMKLEPGRYKIISLNVPSMYATLTVK